MSLSTFIADLFDVATQGDPSQSPIHLDAASNVLRIFVNMIHSGDTPYLEIKVADYVTLLTICDRLQCPDIEKAVVSSLKLGAAKDPWAVFTLASQRNDVGLAKAALEAMGEGRSSPATRLPKLLPQDMDGVRTSFFVELIGRRLSSAYDHNCKIVHYHMVDWSTVARDFSPKV